MANLRFPFRHRYFTRSNLTPINAANIILQNLFFGPDTPAAAIISVVSHSTDKISDEIGKTSCAVTFSPDKNIESWEARATYPGQTPAPGVGWVVGSGGAISAGSEDSLLITYDQLVYGDLDYTISFYQLT